MKKLVLFDLDGTLINSIDDLADSTNYALQQCGLPLHTVDEYKYFVGNSVDPLIRRALPEEEKENQELFDRVKKIYLSYYAAHSKDKTRPYPGISDLLSRCNKAGVLVAVVSNKPDDITADVVRYYFPQIHFAATMGPKEGIPKKPDPAGVFKIEEYLGLAPEDFLYVGDTSVDMRTGKNAGLFTVGVLWGFRTGDELCGAGASYLVRSPEDIRVLVLDA